MAFPDDERGGSRKRLCARQSRCNDVVKGDIDDLTLLQAIERQINKVELANRFTRAMAVGNPRDFTQVEKEKQHHLLGGTHISKLGTTDRISPSLLKDALQFLSFNLQ